MARLDILREIERLDPERDHQRILHLSFGYEFPWDSTRALELALYRTYCVPSIAGVLDRAGEFHRAPQRRYDDTALLIAEICKGGYEEGRGREALERINRTHAHFRIANDDFLYVLSTFVFEPIRWIDRFGWRPTCRNERLGYFWFWREVGRRMGIRDLPPSFEAFEAWARDYEAACFQYDDANRRIGLATRELFVSWYPRPLAPVVRLAVHALLDEPMREAFGFPRLPAPMRALIHALLRLRGAFVRRLPPRREPCFFTDRPNRTHPRGYRIAELGPPRMITAERQAGTERAPSAPIRAPGSSGSRESPGSFTTRPPPGSRR